MTSQIWRHQYKQNFIKWTRPKVWKVKQMMFFEVFDDSKWQNQKKKSKLTKYRNIYFEESSMSNLIEDHLRSVTGIQGSQRVLMMVLRTENLEWSWWISWSGFVDPDMLITDTTGPVWAGGSSNLGPDLNIAWFGDQWIPDQKRLNLNFSVRFRFGAILEFFRG